MSFICHIHNYTEYKGGMQWRTLQFLHLTHPSGAVGYNDSHSCFYCAPSRISVSCIHSTVRRPGSSWGVSALLKGLTSVVDTFCQSRDSNPQPWVTSGFICNRLLTYCRFSLPSLVQVYNFVSGVLWQLFGLGHSGVWSGTVWGCGQVSFILITSSNRCH